MFLCTGVDLSKILGGLTKILEGPKVVKSDKRMGVSQLVGTLIEIEMHTRARAAHPSLRLWFYVGKLS